MERISTKSDTSKKDSKIKNKLLFVLLIGLLIRLILAPYTSLSSTWETSIIPLNLVYVNGFNPCAYIVSHGAAQFIFFLPVFVPFALLNQMLGIHQAFILVFLSKLPTIAADVLSVYCLYNIGVLVLKNKNMSLKIVSAYFLNPFVIFLSAVAGIPEQITIAFLLLSMLYLLKQKIKLSALMFSIASSVTFVCFLLLPGFLSYIRKKGHFAEGKHGLWSFLLSLLLACLVLFSPNLLSFVTLSSFPSAASAYLSSFLGPVGSYTIHVTSAHTFKYNFTGFLSMLGLGDNPIFPSLGLFLLSYLVLSFLMIKHSKSSFHFLNRYTLVVFSLFILFIPLSQHWYLMWIFPFLIIEALLFKRLPLHYVHILWLTNLIIFPILELHFLLWFDNTFTLGMSSLYQIVSQGSLYSSITLPLQLSISVLYSLFLLLVVYRCLMSDNK